MKIYLYKNVQIAAFFILVNLLAVTWAKDMKSPYVTSEPRTLHMLPVSKHYRHYRAAEVFVDANDNIIVLCSFLFRDDLVEIHTPEDLKEAQNKFYTKALLFVFDDNSRVESSITQAGFPRWRGMLDNGQFQAYSVHIPQAKEPSTVETISIYNLTSDMKLSFSPTKIIKMDKSKKAFPQEDYRHIHELLPLASESDKFVVVGYYCESRFNPIDLIGRVMSAGHWGFVEKLFAAPVEKYDITGYYKIPAKLKTNECLDRRTFVVSGTKIHSVMQKYRAYHSDPDVILYAYFDLSNNHWSKPVKLFNGYKERKNFRSSFSVPSLACYNENIYCAWHWSVTSRTSDYEYLRPVSTGESGVCFCSRVDNQWTKPIKIADLGKKPKLAVDNDGKLHVIWIGQHKGIFHKVMSYGCWSKANLVFEDTRVGGPLNMIIDRENNLNIVYARTSVRESKSMRRKFEPEELVYLKLAKAPQ